MLNIGSISKGRNFLKVLEHEKSLTDQIHIDVSEKWLVSLRKPVQEFKESRSARIVLYHKDYKAIIAHSNVVYDAGNSNLFIGDVVSKIENKGYGSEVLAFAINLAKDVGCSSITGNLEATDMDHFDKLKYWYEKYGFDVKTNGSEGTIWRSL